MVMESDIINSYNHNQPLNGLEPGYMAPDIVVPTISVNERIDSLVNHILKLSQERLHAEPESTLERGLASQIDDLKRQTAYWAEDPNFDASNDLLNRNKSLERVEARPVAYEAWSGRTLDEGLFVSRQLDTSTLAGRLSMRPSDPEGPVHRKLFYAEIEVDYERVLSPRLSGGADVAIISSPEQLIYDEKVERLSIASSDNEQKSGVFDAWLITDSEMAKSTPMEMAVADCPAVFLTFSKGGTTVASGGAHAGWPNVLNGVAKNFGDALESSGIEYDAVEIVIGPGATNLTLPTRLFSDYNNLEVEALKDFIILNEDDVAGFEDQSTFTLDSVALASKVFSDAVSREDVFVAVEDTGINTLDQSNYLSSYRREGKYAGDEISLQRPAGGRFLAVFVPDIREANSTYRKKLLTSIG